MQIEAGSADWGWTNDSIVIRRVSSRSAVVEGYTEMFWQLDYGLACFEGLTGRFLTAYLVWQNSAEVFRPCCGAATNQSLESFVKLFDMATWSTPRNFRILLVKETKTACEPKRNFNSKFDLTRQKRLHTDLFLMIQIKFVTIGLVSRWMVRVSPTCRETVHQYNQFFDAAL